MYSQLVNLRYDGSKGVRKHIVEMANLVEKLKEAKMTMSDELLSQIVQIHFHPHLTPS